MRCVALCALLCLPAALHAAKAPIRIIGSLAQSPPVAPHSRSSNPLVPCSTIVDSGKSKCNRAGYPSVQAWMANLTSDARGTVKFLTPDYRSRTVLAHPDELKLNHAVWRNLGLDFVTMRNEYLFSAKNTNSRLEDFMGQSPSPWVMSDFIVDTEYPYLANLLQLSHVKVIDGVKVGVLVLWASSYADKSFSSFPHAHILPILTRRLRMDGVDKIVVYLTGIVSGTEDDFLVLSANDIDVVVTDIVRKETPRYVLNGTTVLTAPTFYGTRNDLLVLEMVQDGSLWDYTLRDIPLIYSKPAGYTSDPAYIAAKQWMQVEMERSFANDITIAELTSAMPGAQDSTGIICNLRECEVGTLTADAMRERAGAELSMTNAAAARSGTGWPVGPVKRSRLWDTYPFANTVCRVNVSGTVVVDMLNNGVSQLLANGTHDKTQQPSGRFPQISGFRFQMNTHLPIGSRVVRVDVMQPDGTFAPLEKRRVYSLALTSYIMDGNSGFEMLAENRQNLGECFVTTMMEATQEYLLRRKTYAPYIDGRIAFDDNAVTIAMRNQSLSDCSELEKHDPYWQDCVACEAGFWRPDATSNVCVERVSDSVNVLMIAGIVVGIVVFLAIPLVWKMTEKQRRINALFNNNKVAEECAVAVMELRLSDLDYLNDLATPNTIQSAFIAIAKQMKMYMEFMPKNLIANYQPSEGDSDSSAVDKRSDGLSASSLSGRSALGVQSSMSQSGSRRAAANAAAANAGAVKSNYARKKRVSVLALNSRSHTATCGALNSEGVRVMHSHLIETFSTVVESFKGLAEAMCGDRLLAAWNTVVDRPSHSALACKAAFELQILNKSEGGDPNEQIVRHIGLSTGTAMFGLFGGTGTKKYDIVGKVVPGAMLLALLNKEYDTQCLFPQSMLHEASTPFYVRIVDYVSHSKLSDGAFIYELESQKGDIAQDEWMYELENADSADPHKAHNKQWKDFIKNGVISLDVNPTGKLLQLKEEGVTGTYCSSCPGLALF